MCICWPIFLQLQIYIPPFQGLRFLLSRVAPSYCRWRPAIDRKRWKRVVDNRKGATSGQETVDWRMEYKVICVFVSTFKLLRLNKYVIHPLILSFLTDSGLANYCEGAPKAERGKARRRRQGEPTPFTHGEAPGEPPGEPPKAGRGARRGAEGRARLQVSRPTPSFI